MTKYALVIIIINKLKKVNRGVIIMNKDKFVKMMAVATMGVIAMGTFAGCSTATDKADGEGAQAKEKIVMGTNAAFPPFEYIEGTEVVGFDVEMAKAIAEDLGKELVVEDMEFAQLLMAVDTGKIDFVAAGMTATEERAEQVDFTQGYFKSKQVIIIKEEETGIATADDLVGKAVGVQLSTTGDLFVSGVEGIEVVQYDKGALAVADVVNGKVDAVVIDEEPAKKIVENYEGVKILEAPFINEEYAIAVKKGNTELLEEMNKSLEGLIEDGTYDELYKKFFGDIEDK